VNLGHTFSTSLHSKAFEHEALDLTNIMPSWPFTIDDALRIDEGRVRC
jgi:hypothetical protein